MAGFLGYQGIRLFDYASWAEPLRDELRQNAERIAADAGLKIEFIRKSNGFRKEKRIKAIIAERGDHPGLVHIFSAMETYPSYRPRHDKLDKSTSLESTSSKCIHYYFYFIDEQFGLCYVRVPTWAPFRLQIYFNGHYWLARQLAKEASVSRCSITHSFISRTWPKRKIPLNLLTPRHCIGTWINGHKTFVPSYVTFTPAITGASCRWNMLLT